MRGVSARSTSLPRRNSSRSANSSSPIRAGRRRPLRMRLRASKRRLPHENPALACCSLGLEHRRGAWLRPTGICAGTDTAATDCPADAKTHARRPPKPPAKPPSASPATQSASPGADLAFGAYQRGYFLTAFHEATKNVDQRQDPKAMTLLGELYANGLGVPANDVQAAKWYSLAAERGDREAMFALAMFRISGPR